jgi:hypothetical protein
MSGPAERSRLFLFAGTPLSIPSLPGLAFEGASVAISGLGGAGLAERAWRGTVPGLAERGRTHPTLVQPPSPHATRSTAPRGSPPSGADPFKTMMVLAHDLFGIMLHNLMGWHHTLVLPKTTISIDRYRAYRFPCAILVCCLNDQFVVILSKTSAIQSFLDLVWAARVLWAPADLSADRARFHKLFRSNTTHTP